MSKQECNRGLEIAIQRLEALAKEYEAHADKLLWETGKGDFFAEGCAYGVIKSVAALKRLLEKNDA